MREKLILIRLIWRKKCEVRVFNFWLNFIKLHKTILTFNRLIKQQCIETIYWLIWLVTYKKPKINNLFLNAH